MPKIKAPKRTKGNPPSDTGISDNLTKKNPRVSVNMNFKVTAEFRRQFKGYANDHDITIKELLQRCFDFYRQHNG